MLRTLVGTGNYYCNIAHGMVPTLVVIGYKLKC